MSPRQSERARWDRRVEQPPRRRHIDETAARKALTTRMPAAANVGPMREPTGVNNAGRAPLPERARQLELDADVTQISGMTAAARCP